MIRRQSSNMLVSFNPTIIADPGQNTVPNFVCLIDNSGTGFVVARASQMITMDNHEIKGLVLTAAHVIADVFSGEFLDSSFSVTFDANRSASGLSIIPIYNFMSENPCQIHSDTTQADYCIPNDLALCVLCGPINAADLIRVNEASQLSEGMNCQVIGHPYKSEKINYAYCTTDLSLDTIKQKAKEVFNGYNKLIISEGSVVKLSRNILEIDCSTTSGLSGSPILVQNGNLLQLGGLYVGGPPLPGQFEVLDYGSELFRLHQLQKLTPKRISKVAKKFKKLIKNFGPLYGGRTNTLLGLLLILIEQLPSKSNKEEEIEIINNMCLKTIYQFASDHKGMRRDGTLFNFNVGIPITNPVFDIVLQWRVRFEQLSGSFSQSELIYALAHP